MQRRVPGPPRSRRGPGGPPIPEEGQAMQGGVLRRAAAVLALSVLAALPARGAGFGIFEQGSKAMGMAGAFTAQADDGSALFHNPGGLAFQNGSFSAGFTYITFSEAEFQGADPFPGSDATGEQETLQQFPPHVYWVKPISDKVKFGLGVNSPFGLAIEWADIDDWEGRYLSTMSGLRSVDVNPTVAWKSNEHFG